MSEEKEYPHGRKGFAGMEQEKRRAIASLGGKAVPGELRSFSRNRELASEAGRKGGAKSKRPQNG